MKFKGYLTEGRTSKISKDTALDLIKKNCGQITEIYKSGSLFITRDIWGDFKDKYGFVDPRKGQPRVSANTYNYYTLLIDDVLPAWKKYPKRSKSIICSLDDTYVGKYLVFPFDRCKIGITQVKDFWWSFNKTLESNLDRLVTYLYRFLLDDFKDGQKLKKVLETITKDKAPAFFREFDRWNSDNVMEIMEHILDPKANKIAVGNIKTVKKYKSSEEREVWIGNGPSVLIDTDVVTNIGNELGMEL